MIVFIILIAAVAAAFLTGGKKIGIATSILIILIIITIDSELGIFIPHVILPSLGKFKQWVVEHSLVIAALCGLVSSAIAYRAMILSRFLMWVGIAAFALFILTNGIPFPPIRGWITIPAEVQIVTQRVMWPLVAVVIILINRVERFRARRKRRLS